MLADVSAVSALVFGIFEFIFHWCAIIGLGAVGRWLGLRLRRKHGWFTVQAKCWL
jgi:hypothetical protein